MYEESAVKKVLMMAYGIAILVVILLFTSNLPFLAIGLLCLTILAATDSYFVNGPYDVTLVTWFGGKPVRGGNGVGEGFHFKLPRPFEFVKDEHRESTKTITIKLHDEFESGGGHCWESVKGYQPDDDDGIEHYASVEGDSIKRIDNVPTEVIAEFEIVNLLRFLKFGRLGFLTSVERRIYSIIQKIYIKYPNRPAILASKKRIEDEIRDYVHGIAWIKVKKGDHWVLQEENLAEDKPDENIPKYYGVRLKTMKIVGTKVPERVRKARDRAEAASAKAQGRATDIASYRREALKILKDASFDPEDDDAKKRPTMGMIQELMDLLMVQDGTIRKTITLHGLDKGTLEKLPHIATAIKALLKNKEQE